MLSRAYWRWLWPAPVVWSLALLAAVLSLAVLGNSEWCMPALVASAILLVAKVRAVVHTVRESRTIALTIVQDARHVYWVQPGAFAAQRSNLHLRDGSTLKVSLREDEMRDLAAWLIESDPSICIDEEYVDRGCAGASSDEACSDNDTAMAALTALRRGRGEPAIDAWAGGTVLKGQRLRQSYGALVAPIGRRYRFWRIAFNLSVVPAALLFFLPESRPWCLPAFALGLLIATKFEKISADVYAAEKAVLFPRFVYWAQLAASSPTWGSGERVHDRHSLRLHLCDGQKLDASLHPENLRLTLDWLSDQNPSVWRGSSFVSVAIPGVGTKGEPREPRHPSFGDGRGEKAAKKGT